MPGGQKGMGAIAIRTEKKGSQTGIEWESTFQRCLGMDRSRIPFVRESITIKNYLLSLVLNKSL